MKTRLSPKYFVTDCKWSPKAAPKNLSIIEITESRPKVGSQPLNNIEPNNYNIDSALTESEKGGMLLNILQI